MKQHEYANFLFYDPSVAALLNKRPSNVMVLQTGLGPHITNNRSAMRCVITKLMTSLGLDRGRLNEWQMVE